MKPLTGLLLIAHGARDPVWAAPFQEVVRRIRLSQPELQVELSFLEFMSPGIEEAGHRLAASGCAEIHVVPMFLGSSGHVRRDVPPLIERLGLHYGNRVVWHQHVALGEADAVMQAMADTSLAWVAAPPTLPSKTP